VAPLQAHRVARRVAAASLVMSRGNTKHGGEFGFEFPWLIASAARPAAPAEATR